jgi:acetylornithine/succinyldiaminopimelate/putrescine aminotransferase
MQSADFISELRKRNILVLPVDDIRVRMVTHLELDQSAIDRAIEAASEIMRKHEHAR